jgi:hypothetical protein
MNLACETDWQVSDVLMIHKIAVAHRRRSFTGDQEFWWPSLTSLSRSELPRR